MRAAQSRVVAGDGVNLHVREWSTDKTPTVVLVHGYPDSSRVWDAVAPLLARQCHVVAYDVRGAGGTDAPARVADYSLAKLADDFKAVIDAVSPERAVHVIAHDWGSIQAWEPVTDPGMADRIASYTSISGPCLDHVGHWMRDRIGSARPAAIAQAARQVASSWYVALFQLPGLGPAAWKAGLDRWWPGILGRLEGIADAAPSPTRRADGVHGVQLYRANFLPRLLRPRERPTAVPVQLIVPTDDPFVRPQLFEGLTRWVPTLWRRDVAGGHWLPLSHPRVVADAALELITAVEHPRRKPPPALVRARVVAEAKPFSRRLAVVTGAGNGIGRETLLTLAEQGAEVVAVDIDSEALKRTVELARLLGAKAHGRRLDVGDQTQWEAFAQWVERTLGAPDIVINNAGIGLAGAFLDTASEDWERVLRVNLWSVIHGSRVFAQQMIAAGKPGHIVNVASAAAFTPTRTLSAYATSKAAVRMLSDCLRAELADRSIQVTSICPGVIDTGITRRSTFVGLSDAQQAAQRRRASQLYARRNLGPKAVASAIVDALIHGRDEMLIGAEAHGFHWISRLAPPLSRRLARVDLAR